MKLLHGLGTGSNEQGCIIWKVMYKTKRTIIKKRKFWKCWFSLIYDYVVIQFYN